MIWQQMCLYAVTGFCENNYGDVKYSGKNGPFVYHKKNCYQRSLDNTHFRLF